MATTKKTETKAVTVKEEVKIPAPPAEVKAEAAVKAEVLKKEAEPKKETAAKKESAPKKAAALKKAAAPKKTETVKAETPPKKEAALKKETAPKKAAASPKAPAKKEVESSIYIQYMEREISTDTLVAEAKKSYVAAGNKAADIKTIDIYVKPEENAAYYVINGIGSEDYKINL